jgi:hypothetical protein
VLVSRRHDYPWKRLDETVRDDPPEGGIFKRRWTIGPDLSQDASCYGFTSFAKIIPGRVRASQNMPQSERD